jgi:hypothetical protein
VDFLRKNVLFVQDVCSARRSGFDALMLALASEVERIGEPHVDPGTVYILIAVLVERIVGVTEIPMNRLVFPIEETTCSYLCIESAIAVGGAESIVGRL